MTDSSTGGILLPTGPAPLNDEALDTFFRTYLASLTGLDPQYVRPRWTGEPATPPDFGSTWAAVGVSAINDDQYAQQELRADGRYLLTRHELLDVLCSFYGARAQEAARRARNNILIAQNREGIEEAGFVFMYAAEPIRAPAMIQTRWTNRIDVTFTFRRAIEEVYDILPVERAVGSFGSNTGPSSAFDTSNQK
jgi:hypothetical protein